MPDWSVAVTYFPPRLTCIGSSSMSLHTAVTALLGIQHPVLSTPMAGISGGALAAAVQTARDRARADCSAPRGIRRTGRHRERASVARLRTPPRPSVRPVLDAGAPWRRRCNCQQPRVQLVEGFEPQPRREEAFTDKPDLVLLPGPSPSPTLARRQPDRRGNG